MKNFDYDLFVIGGGSGGVRAARWSAALGAKVALCEEDQLGGTCVVRGCVPKKMMSTAASMLTGLKVLPSFGVHTQTTQMDWGYFRKARDSEISRLSGIYKKILLNNSVKIISGRGQIESDHIVSVAGQKYSAKHILIATGSRSFSPTFPGSQFLATSNDFFELEKCPQKSLIIGGGFIALELGSILNSFGSEVNIVVRKNKVLRGFDQKSADFLLQEMTKKGIKFHLENTVSHLQVDTPASEDSDTPPPKHPSFTCTLADGKSIQSNFVLSAAGREPNTEGLFLGNMNVERIAKGNRIKTDSKFRSSIPSIYAVGDVMNNHNLTPIALEEGMILAENLFNGQDREMNYDLVPGAVFSNPPLASAGLTEEEAIIKFPHIEIYETDFRPLKYSLSELDTRSFMKLIVDKKSQRVIGCHLVGEDVPEMMQGIAVAMTAGATKADFDSTIGIHPTSAEELTTLRDVVRTLAVP